MSLIPTEFLFRLSFPCTKVSGIPAKKGSLLNLPESCILPGGDLTGEKKPFTEIRVGWNEQGLGIQAEISGKEQTPSGDAESPKASDGVTIWIDTRDARTSHRASRTCHQFFLLPMGGGADKDEAVLIQTKIHRALHDAPLTTSSAIPFRSELRKHGYLVEAFFPAMALSGYDPEEHRRLGFYYAVRDAELGNQFLQVGSEFPISEDPSLWATLELMEG